ncbi:MAG: hypothetical protein CMO55_17065 [Verrucomicrobiales bacterium]|nr:hypothetical protein [Verrucomicrobiales bacterium]
MKAFGIAVLAVCLLAVPLPAYDLTTRDGRVFKDIRLREKTDLGIRIAYEGGGEVFLDYAVIPVPDLWTFGFEEDKYKAAKQPVNSSRKALSSSTPVSTTRYKEDRVSRYGNSSGASSSSSGASNSGSSSGSSGFGLLSSPSRSSSYSSSTSSRQCAGYTQKGYRCKRMVRGGSYCYQHR